MFLDCLSMLRKGSLPPQATSSILQKMLCLSVVAQVWAGGKDYEQVSNLRSIASDEGVAKSSA